MQNFLFLARIQTWIIHICKFIGVKNTHIYGLSLIHSLKTLGGRMRPCFLLLGWMDRVYLVIHKSMFRFIWHVCIEPLLYMRHCSQDCGTWWIRQSQVLFTFMEFTWWLGKQVIETSTQSSCDFQKQPLHLTENKLEKGDKGVVALPQCGDDCY